VPDGIEFAGACIGFGIVQQRRKGCVRQGRVAGDPRDQLLENLGIDHAPLPWPSSQPFGRRIPVPLCILCAFDRIDTDKTRRYADCEHWPKLFDAIPTKG
jgi:hypothetical protein